MVFLSFFHAADRRGAELNYVQAAFLERLPDMVGFIPAALCAGIYFLVFACGLRQLL
jgi:hypothetical protein